MFQNSLKFSLSLTFRTSASCKVDEWLLNLKAFSIKVAFPRWAEVETKFSYGVKRMGVNLPSKSTVPEESVSISAIISSSWMRGLLDSAEKFN